jgi:oligopeptide/dipeptide ABC transporter ATP-binding protein
VTDRALLEVDALRTEIDTPRGVITPVCDVSLTLARGETICLVGESGSGKSLLGRSLMRVLPEGGRIASGTIMLEDTNVTALGEAALRSLRGARIAFVPQDPMTAFDPLFRVGDQIVEAILAHRDMRWEAAVERMLDVLADVGLPDPMRVARSLPSQLSGGMSQRALIAMALSADPAVLIADEPTTALDMTVQAQVLDLLARIQADRGLGVLFVTHDMGVAASIADRILVMYAGRIVEEGPVDAMFAAPRHPYTRGLIASSRAALALDRRYHWISGSPPDLYELPSGCSFSARCEFAREECRTAVPAMRALGRTRAACVLEDDERPWLDHNGRHAEGTVA